MALSILSINMNKRLASKKWYERFCKWTGRQSADMIVLQEPWPHTTNDPVNIEGYCFLGGNSNVCSYLSEKTKHRIELPFFHLNNDRWSTTAIGNLNVHDAYFPCKSGKQGAIERVQLLNEISSVIRDEEGKTNIVFGDFNMSPRTVDGLYDGNTSKWTTGIERDAFNQLLTTNSLIDLGARDDSCFTYEKNARGKPLQYRCDLALVSRACADEGLLSYTVLHEVRLSDDSFTDHSATLVKINVEKL